jgi:UDP-GlcNAc3NAcA epimerase
LKKILTIVGARPQFIKAAIVSKELLHRYEEVVLHTGQHYDENMSGIFFQELGTHKPDINLGIGSGSHSEQTAMMLMGIEKAINSIIPDLILVYGDTNSTLAGALAGVKCQIPVVHVESGLRSYNRAMPEEINRVITDHISSFLFCPSNNSVKNLSKEGIIRNVFMVGDVMYDSFLHFSKIDTKGTSIIDRLQLEPKKFSLLTLHRAENTDDLKRLVTILSSINRIKDKIIFPVHPRTSKMLEQTKWIPAPNVCMISPVGYLDMVDLEQHAECILTDSGGIQKEAYWAGVRCITLRRETEWIETVEQGWNVLADDNIEEIIELHKSFHPIKDRNPIYGDGNTAIKIVDVLNNEF